MNERDELGSGVLSVPLAVLYGAGVIRYEEAKAINMKLIDAEAPDNFAELCMLVKKTIEKVNEKP